MTLILDACGNGLKLSWRRQSGVSADAGTALVDVEALEPGRSDANALCVACTVIESIFCDKFSTCLPSAQGILVVVRVCGFSSSIPALSHHTIHIVSAIYIDSKQNDKSRGNGLVEIGRASCRERVCTSV